jgi:hypothetical protein
MPAMIKAALMAIGVISEGCDELMRDNVKEIIELI